MNDLTSIYPRTAWSKQALTLVGLLIFCLMAIPCFWDHASAADIERITKEQLKEMMGSANPIIVDVRREKHWKDSASKIKGAIRGNPESFETWSDNYPKTSVLVLYCA